MVAELPLSSLPVTIRAGSNGFSYLLEANAQVASLEARSAQQSRRGIGARTAVCRSSAAQVCRTIMAVKFVDELAWSAGFRRRLGIVALIRTAALVQLKSIFCEGQGIYPADLQ